MTTHGLTGIWKLLALLVKANLWEVLAIIGVVQIVILPVIAASTRVRVAAIVLLAAVHIGDFAMVQLLLRLRQTERAGRRIWD